ncbi:MAG TPA: hypothetical protein VGW11_06750 [Solirubrobacteraceae bacterium]|nr:hypothetical protein [Solirubrobacteraceae bacterium]
MSALRRGRRGHRSRETRQPCYACALGGEDERTLFCMTAPSPVRGEVDGRGLGTIEVAQV